MEFNIKTPQDCRPQELAEFARLVAEGGQVALKDLEANIKKSLYLGFVTQKGELIGIAAIKQPPFEKRKIVFAAAQTNSDPNGVELELGYFFTVENHRGKGVNHTLVVELLKRIGDKPVFSMTRQDNATAKKLLLKFGFHFQGIPFPSSRGNYALELYIR